MAELLPNWLQENCYPAQYDRLMLGNLVCGEGIADVGGGSLLVTTGGSGLELDVAQGGGWVEGDDDDRGMYSIYNDAPVTLTATAANPTNPRIDQVIARVYDSTYGEGADEWVLEMLDGTPTGGASLSNLNGATALPDNAIRLAYVLVPATFAGPFVNATHILDARQSFLTCDGSWQNFVPTLTGVTGTWNVARFTETNGVVVAVYSLDLTGAPSGDVNIGLPRPLRNGGSTSVALGSGAVLNGSGFWNALAFSNGANAFRVYFEDGTPPMVVVGSGQGWVSTDNIVVTITYEPER